MKRNKKGYFALRAGRALRARPYLGRYVCLLRLSIFISIVVPFCYAHAESKTSVLVNQPEGSVSQEDLEKMLVQHLKTIETQQNIVIEEFKKGNCQDRNLVTNNLGAEYELLSQKQFENLQSLHCGINSHNTSSDDG